jgi:type IV pilus secretin PilQ/predicted competence protein
MIGREFIYYSLAAMVVMGCAAQRTAPVAREYRTEVSGTGVVSSDPGDGRAAASVGPAPVVPRPFAPEEGLRVVDMRAAGDQEGARVVVQFSRTPDGIRTFSLENPPRCVADITGQVWDSAGQDQGDTGLSRVPRFRIGRYSDKLRVVFELAPASQETCFWEDQGSSLVMGVGAKPIGAATRKVFAVTDPPPGASARAALVLAIATDGEVAPEPMILAAVSESPAVVPAAADPALAAIREIEKAAAQPVAPAEARSTLRAPRNVSSISRDPEPVPQYSGKRITLEFKDADILNVMRIIADVAERNIVATDDVVGRITIVLHDVPWDQALDILLKSTGLEMVSYDDVLVVSTAKRLEEERKARLAARQAGQELEPLETAYLRVNYVNPNEIARILRGGRSSSASNESNARNRRGMLSPRGLVMVNESTNMIIVRDVADGVINATELVRRLDVQTAQVAIQGLIFEADSEVARDLGVRWGASYVASPQTGNPTGKNFPGRIGVGGSGPTNAGASGAPILVDFPAKGIAAGAGSTLGLVLGSLDGTSQLDAEITAIENEGKGKVISRPKVITLNNREAQIQSLEILRVKLPSTGTVINTGPGGSAGANTTATQAIDTGIILRVTPQVSSDGYVLLQLFVKSSVPSTAQTDGIPNEISRQATSQVLVRDGETVVIGGVYRQQAVKAEGGVPWLKDIPVLGWLFKNQSTQDRRQELLVFITPRVVWRKDAPGELPSAADLWRERDRSAYEISAPEMQSASPLSTIP